MDWEDSIDVYQAEYTAKSADTIRSDFRAVCLDEKKNKVAIFGGYNQRKKTISKDIQQKQHQSKKGIDFTADPLIRILNDDCIPQPSIYKNKDNPFSTNMKNGYPIFYKILQVGIGSICDY